MKTTLLAAALALWTLAAIAGDAQMKALLVGTWAVDENTTYTFTPDGRWLVADPKFLNESFPNQSDDSPDRWDIKEGQFIEIRPKPEGARPYRILFLTKHECLLHWTHHGGGYSLWTR